MGLLENENDSWHFVRQCEVCAICQGKKPVGKIVCDNCRLTKTFLSMTALLEHDEMSLRWNASRQPDRPATQRRTDPSLAPCPHCRAKNAVFMRFEAPGKIVGHVITPNVLYYVRCNSCGNFTVPVNSKRLAARLWVASSHWVMRSRHESE
jgi:predicted nucleic-acid-binding Zn-ribbon protein